MKIACIGYFEGNGGAERQLLMLASYLAERNNEVYVIALSSNNICFDYSKKIKLIDLAQAERKSNGGIIKRYELLKETLYKIEPDTTIHFWYQSVYFSSIMDRKKIGKVVFSERGDPGDKEYGGVLGLLRRLTIHSVSGFVFQSEGARDYFGKKIRDKSIVIHNPVSVPIEQISEPCKERNNIIVTVGRLHPQKNHKLLIEAFSKIVDKYPHHVLEIYGDGELHDELTMKIEELTLQDKVFLKGTTKNIYSVMRNSALFVLSSDYEGMPNVLMEAMALGVPCISTDCRPGGARTLIQDGINGYIVPREDADALAKGMSRALENKDIYKLQQEAQCIIKTHKPEQIFERWLSFISSLN